MVNIEKYKAELEAAIYEGADEKFYIGGKAIEKVFNNVIKEALTEYTDFLLKNQYCDADVYCEPPSAIDRFLFPKLDERY